MIEEHNPLKHKHRERVKIYYFRRKQIQQYNKTVKKCLTLVILQKKTQSLHQKPYLPSLEMSQKAQKYQVILSFHLIFGSKKTVLLISKKFKARAASQHFSIKGASFFFFFFLEPKDYASLVFKYHTNFVSAKKRLSFSQIHEFEMIPIFIRTPFKRSPF